MIFWGASENEFWAGKSELQLALVMSKSVTVFSLHPDFLTVFDKMTQEQDACKLKCFNRILTCREYWCFYMNMSTKLSVLKYL